MADLFVSLVAINPLVSKLVGIHADRAPGISPSMKDGITSERSLAPTGARIPPKTASLNAVVVP